MFINLFEAQISKESPCMFLLRERITLMRTYIYWGPPRGSFVVTFLTARRSPRFKSRPGDIFVFVSFLTLLTLRVSSGLFWRICECLLLYREFMLAVDYL